MNDKITLRIAEELGVQTTQVEAARRLLDEGSTVPFIARYRKEATNGLDDAQLRKLEERLLYLRELEERRAAVLSSVEEQGKLTPELRKALLAAATKVELEDLYRPYKPRRRTKAQIAREAGLEPLARTLLDDPTQDPTALAAGFASEERGVADAAAALEGAQQILMEEFAEDPEVVRRARARLEAEAVMVARVVPGKEEEGARFRDYFEHDEGWDQMPSHRALAVLRARKEGVLRLYLGEGAELEPIGSDPSGRGQGAVQERFAIADQGRPADRFLIETARLAYRVKLTTHLETDLMTSLRERAEEEAIAVFAANLRDLLLAAPAGPKAILGLDPGLRTGVKVAVVDRTGQLVDTATIYPHVPRREWDRSIDVLAALCHKHGVNLVSIG
ncbi:MAG: Tex-like N-terminal domain-containing protein, partial [Planctomycetota bacterium]